MIQICPNCSNIDLDELINIFPDEEVIVGCIGMCGTPFAAYVNDVLIEAESGEDLIETIKSLV